MSLCRSLLLAAVATIACIEPPSIAQTTATPAPSSSPAFDVVSIRPSGPGASGSDSTFNIEIYTATNATLKSIIKYDAYNIAGP